MIINIIVICTMIIVPFIFAYYKIREHFAKLTWLMKEDDKWCFKDWADPLVSMAAVLGLILVLIQNTKHPIMAGFNLIFSAMIIIIPTAYKALFKPKNTPVWAFLTFAIITFGTVTAELGNAMMLADDDIIQAIPPSALVTFRVLMGLAALFALVYSIRSVSQTIGDQAEEPSANHGSLKTSIQQHFMKALGFLHTKGEEQQVSNTAKSGSLF